MTKLHLWKKIPWTLSWSVFLMQSFLPQLTSKLKFGHCLVCVFVSSMQQCPLKRWTLRQMWNQRQSHWCGQNIWNKKLNLTKTIEIQSTTSNQIQQWLLWCLQTSCQVPQTSQADHPQHLWTDPCQKRETNATSCNRHQHVQCLPSWCSTERFVKINKKRLFLICFQSKLSQTVTVLVDKMREKWFPEHQSDFDENAGR